MKLKLPSRKKQRLLRPTLDFTMESAGELGAKKSFLGSKSKVVSARLAKIKPKSGYSHVFHIILVVLLPIVMYVLVRIDFSQLALALVLGS